MKTIRNRPLILALLVVILGIAGVLLIFQGRRRSPSSSLSPDGKPRDFHRIICAAPSITEMVFALGKGPEVVGVSDFSFYPPEAKDVARIGGLFNPSREKILALDPDLVVFQGKHRTLARFCEERDIPSLSLTIDRMADITAALLTLGAALQTEQEAARLLSYKAAWMFDRGMPTATVGHYANMAKLKASEMVVDAFDAAIQSHGGAGFVKENHLISMWAPARLFKTAPVNNEMVLNQLAEHLLGLPRSY